MRDWTNVAIKYLSGEDNLKCPVCGSPGLRAERKEKGMHLSLWFICDACKTLSHFDGMVNDRKEQ